MPKNKKLYENEDELLYIGKDNEERLLCGVFYDGHALCTDSDTEEEVLVTYPRYSELTDAQIAEIEDVTQRPLDAYFDIALLYGEITER